MSRVPSYAAFPSVDAMQAELDRVATAHPGQVRLRRSGTSRLGEPLHALTVGHGPADAVVIGGPHPNEPVGSLTISALIELLCQDAGWCAELGYRWHFVPCGIATERAASR